MQAAETVTLYRPVGQTEYELIEASNFRTFPPRLDWQPIFYPVLTEAYANHIAREWNTADEFSGHVGHVLRFEVRKNLLDRYEVHKVGDRTALEYWIPANDLTTFNDNIVGQIERIVTFRQTAEA